MKNVETQNSVNQKHRYIPADVKGKKCSDKAEKWFFKIKTQSINFTLL